MHVYNPIDFAHAHGEITSLKPRESLSPLNFLTLQHLYRIFKDTAGFCKGCFPLVDVMHRNHGLELRVDSELGPVPNWDVAHKTRCVFGDLVTLAGQTGRSLSFFNTH